MPASTVEETFRAAVVAVAEGRTEDAAQVLQMLRPPRPEAVPERRASLPLQIAIFRRDGFICRYCGKRTLFPAVLRVLSHLFPELLPYHRNWKWAETHPLYWTHATSLDHRIPVARGGESTAENLITACYQCNSIKQNWLLEELCWELRPVELGSSAWDGLTGEYARLCSAAGLERNKYHSAWLAALSQDAREGCGARAPLLSGKGGCG